MTFHQPEYKEIYSSTNILLFSFRTSVKKFKAQQQPFTSISYQESLIPDPDPAF
jgi:hypothetical protein